MTGSVLRLNSEKFLGSVSNSRSSRANIWSRSIFRYTFLLFCVFLLLLFIISNLFVVLIHHDLRLSRVTLIDFEFSFHIVVDPLSNLLDLIFINIVDTLAMFLIVAPLACIDITILIVVFSLPIHQTVDPAALLPCSAWPFVLSMAVPLALGEISIVLMLVLSRPPSETLELALDEETLEEFTLIFLFAFKGIENTHALRDL